MNMKLIKLRNVFILTVLMIIAILNSACQKKHLLDAEIAGESAWKSKANTSAATINGNMSGQGGPNVTYLRGIASGGLGGFTDSVTVNRLSIQVDTAVGNQIVNGIRNLYSETNFGEFTKDANGVYHNFLKPVYTDLLKYVRNIKADPTEKLVLINQIGGTPNKAPNSVYPLALRYENTELDYVPLPTLGESMTAFQNNFVEWALAVDNDIEPGYHSIWLGHQEPAHTLGFIDNIETDDAKELNIRRFVDYWKPIASSLRAAGAKVGGIQNNSSNANHFYTYTTNYLKQQNVKLDYLTFQFYLWGDRADLDSAVATLDSYNQKFPGTKMIINRGMWQKVCCSTRQEAVSTSKGMIAFLNGEKNYMDYADKIYAYLWDDNRTDLNLMEFKVAKWLNKVMSPYRRPLTGLPSGVDGFLTGGINKATSALWNTSDATQTITLKLNNTSFTEQKILIVHKGSGSDYTLLSGAGAPVWDSATKTIGPITLAKDEFVLITLQ